MLKWHLLFQQRYYAVNTMKILQKIQNFPLKVDQISRLNSTSENKIIERINSGESDVVVRMRFLTVKLNLKN